jgi:hypothetical protein
MGLDEGAADFAAEPDDKLRSASSSQRRSLTVGVDRRSDGEGFEVVDRVAALAARIPLLNSTGFSNA